MNQVIKNFRSRHILVVGDSILDKTVLTKAIGISLESPTLKTSEIEENISFGGASNVAKNILALGAKCTFLTLLGKDKYFENYVDLGKELNLIPIITDRKNTVKSRYWVEKEDVRYKYLQINRGTSAPIEEDKFNEFFGEFKKALPSVDVVVFVDYNTGVFSNKNNTSLMIEAASAAGKTTIVNSQISDGKNRYPRFAGTGLFCMNEVEALSNYPSFTATNAGITGLCESLSADVCVTLGDKGCIASISGATIKLPANFVEPVDPTGAGDSFLAALSVSLPEQDFRFCNLWASLSIKKMGTTCPSLEEINEPNE